jgi:stage III sporulation protein AD
MNIFNILGISVCSAVIAGIVRQLNRELALFVGLGCTVVLTYYAVQCFKPLLQLVTGFAANPGNGYISTVIKLAATGAVTAVASDICRDMGTPSVASSLELTARLEIVVLTLPLISLLLDSIRALFAEAGL